MSTLPSRPLWAQIRVIAGKEFHDRIRNRWVLAISIVFAAFTLAISYFGAAAQGAVGFHGIEPLIASLVSLAIYLLPLIALILGFDGRLGGRARGPRRRLVSGPRPRPGGRGAAPRRPPLRRIARGARAAGRRRRAARVRRR